MLFHSFETCLIDRYTVLIYQFVDLMGRPHDKPSSCTLHLDSLLSSVKHTYQSDKETLMGCQSAEVKTNFFHNQPAGLVDGKFSNPMAKSISPYT